MVVPALSADASPRRLPAARAIKAMLIDRQPLFLDAIAILLSAPPLSAQVMRCIRTDTALELLRETSVDVVFCELAAQPVSGGEVARTLSVRQPPIPVILLGEPGDEAELTHALRYPVAGLFTKDAGLEEFLVGVDAVLSGHRAISSGLMTRLLDRLDHHSLRESTRPGQHLSQTEREILAMIGDAASISAIAASRGISAKTVRNHLAKIYRKLELHGRTEAMLWAARMGLTSR